MQDQENKKTLDERIEDFEFEKELEKREERNQSKVFFNKNNFVKID